jgi:mannose-6-phosphate isomerase
MIPPLDELRALTQKLDRWLRQESLPLWWSAGRHHNGSFYEALDFSGRPVAKRIARVRVQARQIFSFALAWELGWREPGLVDGLAGSLDRFLNSGIGPQGLPGMLVDIEAGRMTDPQPNLYVTAFTLMALAQCRPVLGTEAVDARIDRLLEHIDKHLACEGGGGYREFLPPGTMRLQNPHMHLYESLLCLYRVTHRADIADRAEQLLNFARRTFFDTTTGVVAEEVDPASPDQPGWYEPGHSLEWVWLLGYRARLFGVPLDPFALQLYGHYCESGCPEGGAPMRLSAGNEPIDPSCRLWSQTEALKAHLCIAELAPKEHATAALERAAACAAAIHDKWLATECKGLFFDHFDAAGKLLSKDVPGSMPYHLIVTVGELSRVAGHIR